MSRYGKDGKLSPSLRRKPAGERRVVVGIPYALKRAIVDRAGRMRIAPADLHERLILQGLALPEIGG